MIHYLIGDATQPKASGKKLIAHIVNDVGGWGRGFVMALSDNWAAPELDYRACYENRKQPDSDYKLGAVRFVPVTDDITVANMIAQHGVTPVHGIPPIRYEALEECLLKVDAYCGFNPCSIHMPRIGCGLAGGCWEDVEPILKRTLGSREIYVYDMASPSV